jgi:hypothetical protein
MTDKTNERTNRCRSVGFMFLHANIMLAKNKTDPFHVPRTQLAMHRLPQLIVLMYLTQKKEGREMARLLCC